MAGGELPSRPALVTFDDGFRNNLTNAAPALKKYGVPAVFHVTTGLVGTSRVLWPQELFELVLSWPHPMFPFPGSRERALPRDGTGRSLIAKAVTEQCKVLPDGTRQSYLENLRSTSSWTPGGGDEELFQFMTWDEVRQLGDEGFTIGSHTVNHPVLSRLDPESLKWELEESKKKIERETGKDCAFLAYPNGGAADISSEVVRASRMAGYSAAFATMQQTNPPPIEPYALRRYSIGRQSVAEFYARISGSYNLLKRAAS